MSAYTDRVVADGAIHLWEANEPGAPIGNPVSDRIGARHGTVITANLTAAEGPAGLPAALRFQDGGAVDIGTAALWGGRRPTRWRHGFTPTR